MMRVRPPRGFTLLEVMMALALLGFGLVVLMKSTGHSIMAAKESQMMGLITDLSRGKMYDIEEVLLKDGFTDSDQSEEGKTFEDEGYPLIKYSYKVEEVELPSFEQLQALGKGQKGAGKGSASGSGAVGSGTEAGDELGGFGNSAFGGMLMQAGGLGDIGGTGESSAEGANGASFIQGQYAMVQEVLKVSIRKVTLDVTYDVLGHPRAMRTVAYYTDAASMDKVLSGLGSQELPASGSGSGSATGTGSTPGKPSLNPKSQVGTGK